MVEAEGVVVLVAVVATKVHCHLRLMDVHNLDTLIRYVKSTTR
jgi:polyphosphate kinase